MTSGDPSSGQSLIDSFVAHWRGLPRDGMVPTLAAFLDKPEPRFAPWTFILDVVSEEALTVRLFGTRMVESFGEITGLNFLDFLKRDVRPAVGRAHQLICERPCGWVTHARAVTTGGRAVIPLTISLPLLHKGERRCVVKLSKIVQRLEYRESLVSVDRLDGDQWIDLGAGVPDVPPTG